MSIKVLVHESGLIINRKIFKSKRKASSFIDKNKRRGLSVLYYVVES